MLYLQEIFDDLALGEFTDLAIGNSTTGSITAEKYPKVISAINRGLLNLYTRFPLKQKECLIYQREGKSLYYLRAAHLGDPNGGDSEIYIDNTVEQYPDNDIILLTGAFDSLGEVIYLNNPKYPDDIFTPEFDVLKMKPADPLKIISLVYQAAYPKIVIEEGFDPKTYELTFPSFLKAALLNFVASQFFVGKKGQATEGNANINNTFLSKYSYECKLLVELGLVVKAEIDTDRFDSNGWC